MALHALENTDDLDDDGEVDNVGAMADVGDDDFEQLRELHFVVCNSVLLSWRINLI